jgi:transcriptional regulator with XRE-family HTH domain
MSNYLETRAQRFGKFVCAELKGAIVTRGFSQAEVALAINKQKANVSKWLNAKPVIAIDVAQSICEYIGVSLEDIVNRANDRLVEEMGPYEDESQREALIDRVVMDPESFGVAALHDENKSRESQGGEGR